MLKCEFTLFYLKKKLGINTQEMDRSSVTEHLVVQHLMGPVVGHFIQINLFFSQECFTYSEHDWRDKREHT